MENTMISRNKSFNKTSVPEITLCLYNLFNNYFLIAYDVVSYFDVFNQGISSLEIIKVLNIGEYSMKHGSWNCGDNPKKCHCSLLDWAKSVKFWK